MCLIIVKTHALCLHRSINNGTRERYDFVVFGATGVTGQHVVEEMTKQIQKKGAHITMAVAGNCEIELRDVLKRLSVYTGQL